MADIYHQFQISAPIQTVFDAFTTPEGLDSWWTLQSQGQPVVGSHYRLYFGHEYDWLARVIHVEGNRELTWAMVRAMDDWLPTTFGFKISMIGTSTCVRFFHRDWEVANDHFAITNYCWAQLLKGLKDYVELGVIIPFDHRN